MIGTITRDIIRENTVGVYENKEAEMRYFPYDFTVRDYDETITFKAGSYIAMEKEFYYNCFSNAVVKSRKGNRTTCKKAFEKYSPKTMKWMKQCHGIA